MRMKIDFVSDIVCPWCVIGLRSLEQALNRLGADATADIHFQPFELNPQMPREGQDIAEHLAQKYGASPAQVQQTREAIRARGAAVGFSFNMDQRSRIYNTFDAHRLLHWAGLVPRDTVPAGHKGRQRPLKHALFSAYFSDGLNPSQPEVLIDLAGNAGLDKGRAHEILATKAYEPEVRAQQAHFLSLGIQAVPAIIINDAHLISGGQPVDVFEQALRQIALS
jgi:predicted DsbA family dithiol-disulfide isomerase